MTIDDAVAAARELGFNNLNSIRMLARQAVALRPEATNESSPLGSRLGGLPTLPASVSWPQHNGQSLAFIAQINLASQPRVIVEQGFPESGLLLFFHDAEQGTWGFDPEDAGSFAVVHVADPHSTRVAAGWPDDLPENARYNECRLACEATVTLPPWDSVLIESLHLDEDQLEAYKNVVDRISGDDDWPTRGLLGGHPDQIQGDMMLECALVTGGVYCGDADAYDDPRVPALSLHANEWRLLLQVPSADAAEMMWGDMGCLYYWIREEDLRARRFDRCWMILQCG